MRYASFLQLFLGIIVAFGCSADESSPKQPGETKPDSSVSDDGSVQDAGDAGECADSDGDAVCDEADECPGQNDAVDSDENNVSDCTENLIDNGQFRTDTTGWGAESDGSAARVGDDANGDDDSGAIEVTNKASENVPTFVGATYCVEVAPSSNLVLSAEYKIDSPEVGLDAWIEAVGFANDDCTGDDGSAFATSGDTSPGWHSLSKTLNTTVSQSSVEVRVRARKSASLGDVSVRFDNVMLRLQ